MTLNRVIAVILPNSVASGAIRWSGFFKLEDPHWLLQKCNPKNLVYGCIYDLWQHSDSKKLQKKNA